MSKRLFVTGGTGYLGREILQQARAQGWHVTASYYHHPPDDDTDNAWVLLDVRDAPAVDRVYAAIRPEVVIHTAFRQNNPDMWDTNAAGAQHVALAARQHNARLIHMSSDVIFSGQRNTPYTEQDTPDPITDYGTSKADAERLVAAAHPEAVLVRTSLIYGFEPVDRHTRFMLDIADGRSNARLFHDEYRCPIFVADLSAALLELADHTYRGTINLAGAQRLSRYEFGVLLAAWYGRDPTTIAGGLTTEFSTPRPRDCTLNIDLARKTLQIPLRGVQEVLQARHSS
jgi:dTDP-4-dehydrorhamnose reductase